MTRYRRCILALSLILLFLSSINQSISQHVHKPHDTTHQSKRSTDQSIHQSIDQPINEHEQPAAQTTIPQSTKDQSIDQSPKQSTSQSIDQSTDQSTKESIDQSIDQSIIHTEIPATYDMAALQQAVLDAREILHEHTLDGLINQSSDQSINQSTIDSSINLSVDQSIETDSLDRSVKLFQEAMEMLDHKSSQSSIQSAIDRLIDASTLGNIEASYELGKIFLFGDLTSRDLKKCEIFFLKAADSGHSASQHFLAFLYSMHLVEGTSALDTAKSVLYDYFAATGGDLGAKLAMGYRFLHGEGVPESCQSALAYYRSAAEVVVNALPSPPHQTLLTIDRAHLLDDTPRMEDSTEVVQYYQHSADSGNIEAAVALGQLHYYGQRGLPQSINLAAKYFKQAAAAGDAAAMTQLGQMHLAGLIDDSTSNNQTAYDLFVRAAALGNSQAQVNLGLIYLTGSIDGVELDYTEAAKYFEAASQKGNAEGQFQLGVMNFGGIGVPQNMDQAFQLFQVSAMNGHTKALFNVAQMQASGLGVTASCSDAVIKMKVVAERGTNSQLLGEAHSSYWEGEWDASFMMYALAAHEGMETGQANAAYLIDRGYVDLWSREGVNKSSLPSAESGDQATNQSVILPVSRNKHSVAYELYRLSADQMNIDSMRMLGDYAFYGYIDPKHESVSVNQSMNQSTNQTGSQLSYLLAANHYTRAGEEGSAQSFFNLGYLYHRGLGVQRDLHLAKRYYDQSITSDPSAYVPATLALTKLHFDVWLEQMKQWWQGSSSKTPQSTNQPTHQPSTITEGQTTLHDPSHTHQSTNQSGTQSTFSWFLNLPCWQWNWYDWYVSLEDTVLAISCCSLAAIIYYRAQRM